MGKLSTESIDFVNQTQDLVLNGFSVEGQRINLPAWVGNIKVVADMPDDLVKATLGTTGQRLKRFAVRANLEHPDIESYFSTLGKSAIDMFKASADILVAAHNDKQAGKDTTNMEADFLANDVDWSRTIRFIQSPSARLLVGVEDRRSQREIKKQVKNVGLKSILQSGTNAENNFFGRPNHFKRFARFSKHYIEEMKEFQNRQELFTSKNMNEMAHTYAKRMRALEESISDTLGFYRIKPDEASVTLARLHDFKWNDSGSITISSRYFDGNHFWIEGSVVDSDEEKVEGLKKALILNTRFVPTGVGAVNFTYQPRMYPMPHFSVPMPDKVQKVIDRAEHLTTLNNSAFFDYFWVLVPSININHPLIQKTKDHWTIRENGGTTIYTDSHEAALALDKQLVKEGCVVPIIIGERDGKCYFLSMWR